MRSIDHVQSCVSEQTWKNYVYQERKLQNINREIAHEITKILAEMFPNEDPKKLRQLWVLFRLVGQKSQGVTLSRAGLEYDEALQ